jgi:hypothetical protein
VHIAPGLVAATWHVPLVPPVGMTQLRPVAHGCVEEHASLSCEYDAQLFVAVSHTKPAPQEMMLAHVTPAVGCGAHVPQPRPTGMEQKPVWHCWLTPHTPPLATLPMDVAQAGGGFVLSM